jgi:hypothetical protein
MSKLRVTETQMTVAESRAHITAERRQSREAAKALYTACRLGKVDEFLAAVDLINASADGWRDAMRRISKLSAVQDDIRSAFLTVWIESKHLPLRIGDRTITARALRLLMRPSPVSSPMLLYRGTSAGERKRHIYGFSWTTRLEIARDKFADMRRTSLGGAVVLRTIAPPSAILLVREDKEYYDEGEVVVDPYKLGSVELVQRLSP